MRKTSTPAILFILLFLPALAIAQGKDTVFLMNGEIIVSTITDTSFYGVKVLKPNSKSKKEMIVEGERVFSYKFANGFEKIVYFQDTMIGNEFTIQETREFIVGERDAQRGFRSHLWPAGNVIVGAASGMTLGSVIAFVPPFAYAAGTLIPKVKIRHSTVSNMNYLKSDTYVIGYERVARKRRTLQSFIGGVVGLGVGFAARSIYNTVNK